MAEAENRSLLKNWWVDSTKTKRYDENCSSVFHLDRWARDLDFVGLPGRFRLCLSRSGYRSLVTDRIHSHVIICRTDTSIGGSDALLLM
jgi:hypothetical protein